MPRDIRAFAKASRQHWGVENNVHWLLDVVFKEDQSRSREGFAAQNLAALRRLALNVLKHDRSKCSMRLKVKKAGWNNDFLNRSTYSARTGEMVGSTQMLLANTD